MVALEHLHACPHCASSEVKPALPCGDRLYGVVDDLEYARCGNCGILFLATRVKESDLGQLYPAAYHPYRPEGATVTGPRSVLLALPAKAVLVLFHRLLPDQLRRITAAHYTPPRPGARFVDFGCGSTAFLDRAAALGWSPIGVDFTPAVVDAVRTAGHEAYLVDDAWESIGAGTVEALRLNHVLEHLYDPWDTMSRLTALLAPGGRLHVAVPNPAGVSALLFGRDWQSFDARHTLLYTPSQAKAFLEKLGLRNVRVVHETLSKDMARSWGYRRARQGRLDRHKVEPLASQVGPNALLTPPNKLAALLRRADRFHLFATK